jgi:PAS domain-containing protein
MSIDQGAAYSIETADQGAEPGFYTWDISKDILYGDSAIAALFGLDPVETARGLPLADYLQRIHPSDRPQIARAISDCIVAGVPQQECYRVLCDEGTYMTVVAYGRCFRDRQGDPVLYSGIIVPSPEDEQGFRVVN